MTETLDTLGAGNIPFDETTHALLVTSSPATTTPGIDVAHPSYATPVEKTVVSVSGTKAASGDNTLIAAPTAPLKIVIVDITLQNESTTATTLLLQDGSGGDTLERILAQNQGDGIAKVYAADARPKLTAATALILNLSGANSCGYTIHYYTE